MHQRSVPSAGGLYPLELYLIADLPPGLRRYDPQAAALEQLSTDVSLNSLIAELMRQVYVANTACLVFISAHLPRTLDKCGARLPPPSVRGRPRRAKSVFIGMGARITRPLAMNLLRFFVYFRSRR